MYYLINKPIIKLAYKLSKDLIGNRRRRKKCAIRNAEDYSKIPESETELHSKDAYISQKEQNVKVNEFNQLHQHIKSLESLLRHLVVQYSEQSDYMDKMLNLLSRPKVPKRLEKRPRFCFRKKKIFYIRFSDKLVY